MAIQLARAIGMQGGIPQSNLPQIIKEGGDAIVGALKEERLAKQAKAKKEQELKDAIAANIKVDNNIAAHPLDRERYQNKGMEVTQDVIMKSIEGKMTPMQFKSYADEKQRELDNFKYQAEKDYKALIAGSDPDMRKQFHTTDFDRLIAGTPSAEVEEEDKDAVTKYNNEKNEIEESRKSTTEGISSSSDLKEDDKQKIIEGLNKTFDEKLANLEPPKKVKKTIEGQRGYFDIPLEERYNNKTDLGLILEKSKIKKSVGVLDAMKDYQNNFQPESLVKVHRDKQGVIVATEDADAIKKSKDKYILSMTSPISYGEKHDIEKSALAYSAMRLMEQENIPEEEKPQRLREYIERLAGESFDEMMETTIRNEKRKTNEARLLKGRTGSDSAEDKKAKVAQITTQQPPALTRLGEKFAEKNEKKAKEAEDKAKRFERAGNVDQKYINSLKKSAQDFKELAKRSREQEFKVEDYYVFSSKPMTDDDRLSLTDEDNKTVKNFVPSYVFKKDGKYYIGGTVPKKDSQGKAISNEFEDVYVPYNEQNYRTLQQNRKGLTEELTKQGGYPTWSGKEAKGSKQYKASDVTQSLVNNLKDGEIVFVDGVKRIKQDGKLKKVKQ